MLRRVILAVATLAASSFLIAAAAAEFSFRCVPRRHRSSHPGTAASKRRTCSELLAKLQAGALGPSCPGIEQSAAEAIAKALGTRRSSSTRPLAPCIGAWIETRNRLGERRGSYVAPFTGAWIETA